MELSDSTTAVVATGFGGPEMLSVTQVPIGLPGPGQVRLRVRAAGTNAVDYKVYSGAFGRDPGQLPMRLGREAAGVVVAAGGDAEGPTGPVEVGDEVIAFPAPGAYAADLVVPAASVVRKPATLSFEEASGLMVTGTTAVHFMRVASVGEGDTVLIHGASGGVGLMAVQLAVAAGARVIATASESGHDHLRTLSAEPVVYGDGLLHRIRAVAPDGVNAALDAVGSPESIEISAELVSNRDRVVALVASPRAFELGFKVVGAAPGADPGTEIRSKARVELVASAEAGKLQVLVAATYALADTAIAHRALTSGHTHGKIVLIP